MGPYGDGAPVFKLCSVPESTVRQKINGPGDERQRITGPYGGQLLPEECFEQIQETTTKICEQEKESQDIENNIELSGNMSDKYHYLQSIPFHYFLFTLSFHNFTFAPDIMRDRGDAIHYFGQSRKEETPQVFVCGQRNEEPSDMRQKRTSQYGRLFNIVLRLGKHNNDDIALTPHEEETKLIVYGNRNLRKEFTQPMDYPWVVFSPNIFGDRGELLTDIISDKGGYPDTQFVEFVEFYSHMGNPKLCFIRKGCQLEP